MLRRRTPHLGDYTTMSRTIALGVIVAVVTVGGITLATKLPQPAAAQQPLDPAIVASHLQQMRDQEALP